MEQSLFLIAVLYGVIARFLTFGGSERTPLLGPPLLAAPPRRILYATAAMFLAGLALFPFGSMEERLLPIPVARWADMEADRRVIGVREGLTETVIYFERLVTGKPVSHVMLTNSFSMSTTGYGVRRYQKLYVYWPVAVHPDLRRALLIGYGVGNTAKAMTDSSSLETIDVVDLSRDILAMNRLVYPNEADLPLRDPRVRVHIEDGRYFLQTTAQRFDLITGEPPPPGIAGVENLYSREYFQCFRSACVRGLGYWLHLRIWRRQHMSILRAFCECSTTAHCGTDRVRTCDDRDPGRRGRYRRSSSHVNGTRLCCARAALGTNSRNSLCSIHRRRRLPPTSHRCSASLTDDDPK